MPTTAEPKTGQYVDFDEYVDFHLNKVRKHVKTTDILTALAGIGALVLGYLLVFVICDHWVVAGGFGTTARVSMLLAIIVAAIGWVVWKVVLPARRRVSALYAADMIERAEPGLQGNLRNLVDLRAAGRDGDTPVTGTMEKRAALRMAEIDVEETVDRRRLLTVSYVFATVVVLGCLYVVFSPKKVSSSLWRALAPTSSVAAPTRTQILEVKPGSVEVLARSQVDITVDVTGEVPEKVAVLFTTQDRRFVDEPLFLREDDEFPKRYVGTLVGENARGLLQDHDYRIAIGYEDEAGEFVVRNESETFTVTVVQPPAATVGEVTITPPKYMGLDPKTRRSGHLDGWEGSTIEWTATTNQPVKRATIQFADDETFETQGEELRMVIGPDGQSLTARLPDWQKRSALDVPPFPKYYRVQVWNDREDSDPEPTTYRVQMKLDLPPEVFLLDPTEDLVGPRARPSNGSVPLTIRAKDDFGVQSLRLRVAKGNETIYVDPIELAEGTTNYQPNEPFVLQLNQPGRLDLVAGDKIEVALQARDNKHRGENWLPQVSRETTPLIIEIAGPAQPQQLDQQRRQDQQRRERRLDEHRRENGDEEGQPQDGGEPREGGQPGDDPQEGDPMGGEPREGDPMNGGAERRPGEADPMMGDPRPGDPTNPEQPGDGTEPDRRPVENDGRGDDEATQQILDRINEQNRQNPMDPMDPMGGDPMDDPTARPDGPPRDPMNIDPKPGDPMPMPGDPMPRDPMPGDPMPMPGEPTMDPMGGDPMGGDPMPGAGTDTDTPKPGAGNDPKPGDPMPGMGTDPKPGDPMPMPGMGTDTPEPGAGNDPQPGDPMGGDPMGGQPKPGAGSDGKTPEERLNDEINQLEQLSKDPEQAPMVKDDLERLIKERDELQKQKRDKMTPNELDEEIDRLKKQQRGDPEAGPKQPGDPNGPEELQKEIDELQKKRDEKQPPNGMPREGGDPSAPMPGEGMGDPMMPGDGMGQPKPGEGMGDPMMPGDGMGMGGTEPKPSESPVDPKTGEPKPGGMVGGMNSEPGGDPMPGDVDGMGMPGDPNAPAQPKPGEGVGPEGMPEEGGPGQPKPGDAEGGRKTDEQLDDEINQLEQLSKDPEKKEEVEGELKRLTKERDRREMTQRELDEEIERLERRKRNESRPSDPRPGDPRTEEQLDDEIDQLRKERATRPEPMGGDPMMGDPQPGDPMPGDPMPGDPMPGDPMGDPMEGAPKPGDGMGDPKPGEGMGDPQPGEGMERPQPGEGMGDPQPGGPMDPNAKPGEGGNNPGGGGAPRGQGTPGDTRATNAEIDESAADLESSRKATELALERLQDQLSRGDVDEELLERLGWNEDDLANYVDRMQQRFQLLDDDAAAPAPESAARKRQFEEMLKGLDFRSTGERRKAREDRRRAVDGFGGRDVPAPPEYRDAADAFSRALPKLFEESKPRKK